MIIFIADGLPFTPYRVRASVHSSASSPRLLPRLCINAANYRGAALLKLPHLPRRFVKMARPLPDKASSKTVFQD